jgi:hypothetical protein
MKILNFCFILVLASSLYADTPAALNPYTFVGRITDARHEGFDTNRVATIEAADSSGTLLARTKTFYRANSSRNYALAVPMATSTAQGYSTQGKTVTISAIDNVGNVWRGVVLDATTGASGGVREVDIVLSKDENQDGIDDSLYNELLMQWENSDYWIFGETFDPYKDYDGDGVSTIKEALSGTNPFNPSDVLRITRFNRYNDETVKRSNGFVELSFNGVGGRAYSVEAASDLSKKDWKTSAFQIDTENELVNVISLPANSGTKSFTVYLIPESSTNAFYRIKAK